MFINPSAPRQSAGSDQILDVSRVFRIGQRHFRLMAMVFLAILATTAAVTMNTKPVFTASTELMIDKVGQQSLVRGDDARGLSQSALDSSIVETQVEVLASRAVAEAVVRKLRLDRDPEFNPALSSPGPVARARGFISSQLSSLKSLGSPSEAEEAGPRNRSLNPVVNSVRSRLGVRRVGTSYVLRVEFTSRDPVKAARIANAFASSYLTAQLESKFSATRHASAWLNGRIGELRQRVVNADTALQNYKIQNNLLSAQGATLTEQEISALNQQAALTRAQQAETQARLSTALSQLASGSSGEDVGETMTSPVIQQLRARRSNISERLANMEPRYLPQHPEMLKAKSELADVDVQIEAEIKRIISNLQAQAAVARERNASLGASVARSRAGLAESNRSMVRLNELQRDADAERTLYETFLSRFKEMSAEAGLAQADAHVVSIARPPGGPSAPNKKLNLLLGSAIGVAAAVSAALLREMFDKGLSDAEIVERELGVPYLGSVPRLSSIVAPADPLRTRPIEHLVVKPVSSFAESFRSLRASIGFARLGGPVKVLAVTSSLAGEGKTTTSLGLARTAGLAGLRTVVLDCDLRQHALNELLGLTPKVGLVEVLKGSARLDEALLLDEPSGAMVLPLMDTHFTPVDLFSSPAMADLLAELRRTFDLVILDTAPVVLVTETRSLARLADSVLLLVHWKHTPRVLAQTAVRLLTAAGASNIGAALTQVDLRQASSVDPGDPAAYYLTNKSYYVH